MPRARKGSVCEFRDERGRVRYKVGITLLDGTRKWKRMPPTTTAKRARDTADSWNEKAAADASLLGGSGAPEGETVAKWFERFCKAQSTRGVRWICDYRSRFTNHVEPHICEDGLSLGEKSVASVTKRDTEGVVAALDHKIATEALRWKTAQNVWSLVTTMFDEACASKTLGLRAREDNPTNNVKPPERGANRAKTFLYPTEFLQLVQCEAVPLHRRRLYAVAVYFYGRCAEVEAIEWDTVNLERGTAWTAV